MTLFMVKRSAESNDIRAHQNALNEVSAWLKPDKLTSKSDMTNNVIFSAKKYEHKPIEDNFSRCLCFGIDENVTLRYLLISLMKE